MTDRSGRDSCDLEPPPSAYERYADTFSRIYREARSIAVALEILDAYRACEARDESAELDLPRRALDVAASLFNIPADRLLERNRRRDVTSGRYVAAWLLRRRHWSLAKIGDFLGLDHTTIIHGLRKVATTSHLLLAALKADQRLADQR